MPLPWPHGCSMPFLLAVPVQHEKSEEPVWCCGAAGTTEAAASRLHGSALTADPDSVPAEYTVVAELYCKHAVHGGRAHGLCVVR